MSAYPVVYQQSPPIERSRLTVFFRGLCVIPHVIVAFFYGLAAYVVTFVAWFVLLFTAHYPAGMYEFMAGYIRYVTRVYGYGLLVVDEFPPFDGGEHPEYPVRVIIAPPQESYSRAATFFRIILLIPIWILQYVFEIWVLVVCVAIWFVAVVMGKTPPGLTEAFRFPIAYYVRSTAYTYLLTDKYPPLSETDTGIVLSK
jgi:hypothetical protein